MAYKYRGRALIIGNEFKDEEWERKGCVEDLKMMRDLFSRLDFLCTVYKELTVQKMLEKIRKAANDNMNVDSECFVLVISSHGEEVGERTPVDRWRQTIHCLNGKVYVDDIFNILKESITLAGKPKLLFLQICRYRNYPTQRENEDMNRYENRHDYGHNIVRVIEHSKPGSTLAGVQETNTADRLHKAIYECDVTSSCENIYSVFESDPEEWNPAPREDLATPTTKRCPSKDADPTERTEDETGSPDNHGADKSTDADTYQNSCPGDFLVMYPVMHEKYAWRDNVKGSYMMQYMYKADNMSVLLKGGNILQYTTKVCKSMAEFELKEFSLDDMRSMFFDSIKVLCKEENRHMLKNIPVNIKKNTEDSVVEKELKDYFQDSLPSKAETKLMTDLIIHVYGDDYKDITLEHLLNNFQQWVISLSDLQNLRCRESVQQYLGSCNITLLREWDDHDLANCFKIICKLSEMKAILHQLLPFKTACCVYHRLTETVTYLPKSERSKMAKVLQELKRHDL